MKNFYAIAIMFVATLFQMNANAQDVLVVEPGIGTLNAAIDANGGDKIYELKAGEWYGLSKIIENVDYHLQIIGQEPVDGGIPATVQNGSDVEGLPFELMFNALGNITLKNIYFVNADLDGQIPSTGLARLQKDGGRMIVDNCIIDPVTQANGITIQSESSKLYFTNNLAIRAGHMRSPNDGHFFVTQGGSMVTGIDSLVVENNTFVCSNTNMWMGGFTAFVHNFVWFNHNTFICGKSQCDWSLYENEYYWTNNLMFDMNTQPWAEAWGRGMPGGDAGTEFVSLIYADTLVVDGVTNETLPSTRKQFVQYNSQYRAQGFYDLIDEINNLDDEDTIQNVYYMPLIWENDPQASGARESKLFANDVAFPHWKYGNYTENINPQFTDPKIYEMEAKFVEWTKPATYLHGLGFPASAFPAATEWPQYHWEPDGDISYNEAWPVFDGTYTNPELLKASIENLPLGDLNWFPAEKAKWLDKKDEIAAHMKAGNTGKFILTSVEEIKSDDLSSATCYPNPFSDATTIEFALLNQAEVEVEILNVLGQSIAVLVNETLSPGAQTVVWDGTGANGDGVYFYVIKVNGVSTTGRVVMSK